MTNLVFATKAEVIKFLEAQKELTSNNAGTKFFPAGTYYLNHGEYSQPDYEPRRYKDGWSIHVTYFYYAGTFHAPCDGRVDPETWENRFN